MNSMFDRPILELRTNYFDEERDFIHDPRDDKTYIKVASGVCPPNINAPGYIVVAGLQYPTASQNPYIWMMAEEAYNDIRDMLLAMSRIHAHYKVDTHYARFKRSKTDNRVYDDFLRHIQRFNMQSFEERRAQIRCEDAPWTNDRGHLKFFLEQLQENLLVGRRTIYWFDPTPPSMMALNGINDWELVKDENTMLGAACYAIAGLLVDRAMFDRSGRMVSGYGVHQLDGKFDPMHTHKLRGEQNGR